MFESLSNHSTLSAFQTEFTKTKYSTFKCDMPKESTVISCYVIGALLAIVVPFIKLSSISKKLKVVLNLGNKRNKAKT